MSRTPSGGCLNGLDDALCVVSQPCVLLFSVLEVLCDNEDVVLAEPDVSDWSEMLEAWVCVFRLVLRPEFESRNSKLFWSSMVMIQL